MTDPIADMLTRIRNAYMSKHDSVKIPHSSIKQEIAKILVEEGYLASYAIQDKLPDKKIKIVLAYKEQLPAIDRIERLSKPGRRVYVKALKIPKTLGGYGLTILSTNKGIMSDKKANQEKIGGEIICRVW